MKGIRIIHAVLKHRGAKRFRTLRPDMTLKTNSSSEKLPIELMFAKIKSNNIELLNKAKQEYTKAKFKSNYGTFFGRKPDLTDYKDMNILKFKKFSQLKCCKILNKATLEYLDNWQATKEHQDYLGMALYSIKSLFTFFKLYEPTLSTQKEIHSNYDKSEKIKAERYDKMLTTITTNLKYKNVNNKSQTARGTKRDFLVVENK